MASLTTGSSNSGASSAESSSTLAAFEPPLGHDRQH